jgi:WD40 repeat protein
MGSCVSWNLHNKEYLASADYDGTVTVLDVNRGQPISAYVEHTARVWCVDHSNDMNGYLASGGDDGNGKYMTGCTVVWRKWVIMIDGTNVIV